MFCCKSEVAFGEGMTGAGFHVIFKCDHFIFDIKGEITAGKQ